MKTLHLTVAVWGLLLASLAGHPAWADVFNMGGTRDPSTGQWTGLASLETVPVGDVGNTADSTGYGTVGYTYNIGKYEVTAGQYTEFLNKVAGVDTYGLYAWSMWHDQFGCKIEQFAGSGTTEDPYRYRVAADAANRPVNFVSFWDSVRFANWLHNGQPSGAQNNSTTEDGAYTLTAQGISKNTVSRNGNWQWAVTTEDEWYKAAYYRGGSTSAGYWLYPTGSNTTPGRDMNDGSGNNANYGSGYYLSSYCRTPVGEFELSDSPYGTFDQGGNVWEWNEAAVYSLSRGMRGGSFDDFAYYLQPLYRYDINPPDGYKYLGFRVVQVPEPATLSLLALGSLLIARRRRA